MWKDIVEMVCERPPRSLRSRLPLTRGDYFILPLCEGESRRRRQGVANTPSRMRVGRRLPSPRAPHISHILSNRQLYMSGEFINAKSIHWRDCRGGSDIVDWQRRTISATAATGASGTHFGPSE